MKHVLDLLIRLKNYPVGHVKLPFEKPQFALAARSMWYQVGNGETVLRNDHLLPVTNTVYELGEVRFRLRDVDHHGPYPNVNRTPALLARRSIRLAPMAVAGVLKPPGALLPSWARQTALSASILAVAP